MRRDVIIRLSKRVRRRWRASVPRLRRAARRQMLLLLATPAILRAHRNVSRRIRQSASERIFRAVWTAIEPLESRMMFSAMAVDGGHVSEAELQQNFLASICQAPAAATKAPTAALGASARSAHHPSKTHPTPASSATATADRAGVTQNVVLLDSNLRDAAQLSQATLPGTKAFIYNSENESAATVLAQVAQWARANDVRIGSLSILSHGHAGAFELGDQWISNQSLAQTAGEWRQLGHLFAPDASVDVFGCDVATPGSDGQVLIDRIAQLSGAAVFASTNLTGKGGDWILEAGSTAQEAPADQSLGLSEPVLSAYDGTLSAFTVTNTNDSGAGSLRQAILNANAAGSGSTINFAIPTSDPNYDSATNTWTISPVSSMPAITQAVTVNGESQTGYTSTPVIVLNGANAGSGADGVDLQSGSDGSIVEGLNIENYNADGIRVESTGDLIAGNWIGLDAAGTAASANGYGVYVNNVGMTTIGGTTTTAGNVISGNINSGIFLNQSSAAGTLIEGNYIGTSADGSTEIGNYDGIYVNGAPNTTIGGTTAAARNVVSGNSSSGILLNAIATTGTLIEGNYVGTNSNGSEAIPNQYGIQAYNAPDTTIGGTITGTGNLISGNSSYGIFLNSASSANNLIENDVIGLNSAESAAIANGYGVYISDSAGNTLGGTAAGAANIISGNTHGGVAITGSSAIDNTIERNSIYANGSASYGIALGAGGIANSGSETPSEPNDYMNSPVFTSALLNGTSLSVAGYVGSAPGQSAFAGSRVEVFIADTSGTHPSGETYLGYLTADANGNFSGSLSVSGFVRGDYLTATATDANGNTSEFGANEDSNNPPTLATSASAAPATVNGATTNLAVLGADDGWGIQPHLHMDCHQQSAGAGNVQR